MARFVERAIKGSFLRQQFDAGRGIFQRIRVLARPRNVDHSA
ncbi:hypothetical protein [Mesorhizobium sp.]|nr:hypothetical protein [Mesorhizobium sp.]